jgi:hypothetical protein
VPYLTASGENVSAPSRRSGLVTSSRSAALNTTIEIGVVLARLIVAAAVDPLCRRAVSPGAVSCAKTGVAQISANEAAASAVAFARGVPGSDDDGGHDIS